MQWLFNKEEIKWERERKKVCSELARRAAKQWWRDVKGKESEMRKKAEIQRPEAEMDLQGINEIQPEEL